MGECEIKEIRDRENIVRSRAKEPRQPKELVRREVLAIHEKAAGQMVRALQASTDSSVSVSDERQEEQRAGGVVWETGVMAGSSIYRAGRSAVSGVREIVRGKASRKDAGTSGTISAAPHMDDTVAATTYPHTAELPARTPEQRGRELAQARAKQRTDRLRERTEAERFRRSESLRKGPAKPARNPPAPRLRNAPAQAQTAAHTASVAAQRAKLLAVRGRQAAQAAGRGIKTVVHALASTARATATAVKSLIAALAAGGTVSVAVVMLICLIALVAGSSFGIFFAAQPTGSGVALQAAVQQLSKDYYAQIKEITESVPHDRVEYAPDGLMAIPWQDVLAVFAADVAAAENGQPVAVLEAAQIDRLKEILWQMNPVTYRTYTEEHEEERTTTDDEGNEITETVTVSETVLEITIQHKTPQEMASTLGFSARQDEQLTLLSDPQYQPLWMELLGGYVNSDGQILTPGDVPVGVDNLQWPLPEAFTITSGFGERIDPISGEHNSHTGTDIAAPEGTPILAAADGTVTIANGTDPWGSGYGYYIKINHGNGFETLYAHCSAICVTPGQTVRQGEIIGHVGSTGNSTGNHLHFEVWVDGMRIDPLQEQS